MPFGIKVQKLWRSIDDEGGTREGEGSPKSAVATQPLDAIPAVYAAVRVLSTTMSSLPVTIETVEDYAEDYGVPDPGHPLSALMRNPSTVYDPWQFWEHTFRRLYIAGASFSAIKRSRRGRVPMELVPARRMLRGYYTPGGRLRYRLELVTNKGGVGALGAIGSYDVVDLPASEVLVIAGPGFDGIDSPSPITYAAIGILELMRGAMVSQERMLQFRHLLNTVTGHQDLAQVDVDKLKQFIDRISDQVKKARDRGTPLVLPPGYTMGDADGMSAVDMELIGLLKWAVEDIARVYNVPPRLLMHYHAGFRATKFEYQQEDFVRNTIQSEAKRVASQLNVKLLMPEDLRMNRRFRVVDDRFRMGSWGEEVLAVKQAVADGGILMPNEGRKRLRYPPTEGGDKLLSPRGAPAQGGAVDEETENRIVEEIMSRFEERYGDLRPAA